MLEEFREEQQAEEQLPGQQGEGDFSLEIPPRGRLSGKTFGKPDHRLLPDYHHCQGGHFVREDEVRRYDGVGRPLCPVHHIPIGEYV